MWKENRVLIISHPYLVVLSIPDEFKLFLHWKVSTLLSRNNNIWLWFDIFQQGIPKHMKKKTEKAKDAVLTYPSATQFKIKAAD